MRKLFWYLRSCFCKHKWAVEEMAVTEREFMWGKEINRRPNIIVGQRCEKCGWHLKYIKF